MKNKFEKGDLVLYLENGEIGKIVDPNSTPNGYWATVMFKNSPEKSNRRNKKETSFSQRIIYCIKGSRIIGFLLFFVLMA